MQLAGVTAVNIRSVSICHNLKRGATFILLRKYDWTRGRIFRWKIRYDKKLKRCSPSNLLNSLNPPSPSFSRIYLTYKEVFELLAKIDFVWKYSKITHDAGANNLHTDKRKWECWILGGQWLNSKWLTILGIALKMKQGASECELHQSIA